MQRKFFWLFIVLTVLVCMGCQKPTVDADKTITLLSIPGVSAPVSGATPVITAIDTAQYTGTITWDPATSPFEATKVYTANIVLTAKAGWTLTGVAANSFTIADATTVTNALNTGTVAAVFPAAHSFSLPMVIVPAGSFRENSIATNATTINAAFRMSTYEITRAQFLAIMGTDPSNTTFSSGDSDPVQSVSWFQAIAFCNKLSICEGLDRVYDVAGLDDAAWTSLSFADIPEFCDNADWNALTTNWSNNGYRLPTNLEWKWAAMGATSDRSNGYSGTGINIKGCTKPFAGSTGSNVIGDCAVFGYNTNDTGSTKTRRSNPVGSKTANELGLYDMTGNVSEWTWGLNADSSLSHLLRDVCGESWDVSAFFCTLERQGGGFFSNGRNDIGFRVIRR